MSITRTIIFLAVAAIFALAQAASDPSRGFSQCSWIGRTCRNDTDCCDGLTCYYFTQDGQPRCGNDGQTRTYRYSYPSYQLPSSSSSYQQSYSWRKYNTRPTYTQTWLNQPITTRWREDIDEPVTRGTYRTFSYEIRCSGPAGQKMCTYIETEVNSGKTHKITRREFQQKTENLEKTTTEVKLFKTCETGSTTKCRCVDEKGIQYGADQHSVKTSGAQPLC